MMRINHTYDHDNHPITELWRFVSFEWEPTIAYSRIPGHFDKDQALQIVKGLSKQASRVHYVQH